jgi:uncharacterized membrane protein
MLISYKWDKKYWLLLLLLIWMGFLLHFFFWLTPPDSLLKEDIYYIWLEGKRIITGENPYGRILASDMRNNDKYATYFPLSYLFSALVQKLGFLEFRDWIYLWRPISFVFHIGIVALVLKYFRDRGLLALGFAASLIILLGRWSIHIVKVQQLEFSTIFFLLFSLFLLKQRPRLSLFMFGISLAIKQIAIFLLPLYLIYLWKIEDKDKRVKNLFFGLLIISSIPFLTSLPFLIWDAEAFIKSILFSATRFADIHVDAPSADVIVSRKFAWFIGLKAKIPMLILMCIIYFSFLKEKVGIFICCTMVMMTFVYFNSVLYFQYFIWCICLIPFGLVEFKRLSPSFSGRSS